MGFFSEIASAVLSQQTSFEKEMDAIKAKYRKIKAEIQNTDEYGRSLKIEQVKKTRVRRNKDRASKKNKSP
ncbi:hypothetical protein [Helicobacter sp.]|uniref:hypothetical protein n=1 Tax=Helicobacter sp. TaxID=218 RepID=UPI00258D587C|nr:hypothetical protein [Helicobacter sp.]MCI7046506.1 hypothetical protein [Helicobacter sp.]MCI7765868.1 hypothetical protein [Helicobacter sp.]